MCGLQPGKIYRGKRLGRGEEQDDELVLVASRNGKRKFTVRESELRSPQAPFLIISRNPNGGVCDVPSLFSLLLACAETRFFCDVNPDPIRLRIQSIPEGFLFLS